MAACFSLTWMRTSSIFSNIFNRSVQSWKGQYRSCRGISETLLAFWVKIIRAICTLTGAVFQFLFGILYPFSGPFHRFSGLIHFFFKSFTLFFRILRRFSRIFLRSFSSLIEGISARRWMISQETSIIRYDAPESVMPQKYVAQKVVMVQEVCSSMSTTWCREKSQLPLMVLGERQVLPVTWFLDEVASGVKRERCYECPWSFPVWKSVLTVVDISGRKGPISYQEVSKILAKYSLRLPGNYRPLVRIRLWWTLSAISPLLLIVRCSH
jgi:hypothetical protein